MNRAIHPWAWQPCVVYYPPTGQYLMANWATGCAEDGSSFWMAWSDFPVVDDQRPFYTFNLQNVEVVTG